MAGEDIYLGLLERGMPEHVALAYMDSFQSESGMNPGINERNPLVKGSRGGRGLYQLTGPRRREYEAKYGEGYDVDSQLDFLMDELAGSEKRAAEKIFATNNREDAVRAITADFLRPAVDNSDHRIGSWGKNQAGGINPTRPPNPGRPPQRGLPEPPPTYADNGIGRLQQKRDEMRSGLGDKLGINDETMKGAGRGLLELSRQFQSGSFG